MSDWQEIKLKTLISEMGDGGTPTTSEDGNFGGDIPWVVVEDVVPEIYKTKENLTEKGFKRCSAKLWNEEAIILTTGATIGNVGIAKVKLCTKQGITGIVCNKFADNYFLKFWFEANINQLLRYAQGTTFKEIRTRALGNLKIKIPYPYTSDSVSEQRTIATILTKVDDAIIATKNSIFKAERLKKALMQNLLTGKLKPDGTWRKEDEFYKDEKFGNVPIGWAVERFDKLCKRRTEPFEPRKNKSALMYVGLEHIEPDKFCLNGYGSSDETVSTKVKFYFGDILYGKLRPYLNKVVKMEFDGVTTTECLVLYSEENLDWIYLNLQQVRFLNYTQSMTAGTQHPRVRWKDIAKYMISHPKDIDEQNDITRKISELEKQVVSKQTKIKKLERLKKALMQNLLTGKVRVKVLTEQLKQKK